MGENVTCAAGGAHDYKVAEQCYSKELDTGNMTSTRTVEFDSTVSYTMLYCSKCGGTKEIIVQPFIPEAAQGDKRILLLDGEVLGAILRVHSETDFRNNLMAGGRAEPTTITAEDQRIIAVLRPHLKTLGLSFVGLDIIGRYLTEVNVTSPTCLQEMNRLNHVRLEDEVIDYVEGLVAKRRTTV